MTMRYEFMDRIEAWAGSQANEPGGSEAIRRLVEIGLRPNLNEWQPDIGGSQPSSRALEFGGVCLEEITRYGSISDATVA
jgi:hypothetical protein